MELVLTRICLGKDIMHAWQALMRREDGDSRRYSISLSPKSYVPGEASARKTGQMRFKSVDLNIKTFIRKKRFHFFGQEVWEQENGLIIDLYDLQLDAKYDALALVVTFTAKGAIIKFDDKLSPAAVKRQVMEIISEFMASLEKLKIAEVT